MGGKSTFLRSAAHLVVLAQAGSFVPADEAQIEVCDAVFARVGAGDDVARDKSTFLVEMEEASAIVRRATKRSLVVVDELGRGTAAREGLALAWAVLEHLVGTARCKVLFATHFSEVVRLAQQAGACAPDPSAPEGFPIHCYQVGVELTRDGPVLTHRIVRGTASHSHAVHVARMAGLPGPLLQRAEEILRSLG